MRITGEMTTDGVLERLFELEVGGEQVPGVIWSSSGASSASPILLMGHGGGQHKKFPGIVSRARKYVASSGFVVVAIDAPGHGDRTPSEQDLRFVEEMRTGALQGERLGEAVARQNARLAKIAVPEWQATLDAVEALHSTGEAVPVGYVGVSMGGAIGVHLIAVESRITAAVFGLVGLIASDQALAEAAARVTIPIQFVIQWDDELVPRDASLALFDCFASPEKSIHGNAGRHTEVPAYEREGWDRFFTRHLLPSN